MPETRFTSLRNAFLTGLLLVAPLVVTVWALRVIIGIVGGSITPLFSPYLPDALSHLPAIVWDILTTAIVLALVTLLGYFSRLFLGRFVGVEVIRARVHVDLDHEMRLLDRERHGSVERGSQELL